MLLLLTLFVFVSRCLSFEEDLTVEVDAGKMDCFYQNVKKPGSIEVEYQSLFGEDWFSIKGEIRLEMRQVIDGGDLDINFFIQGPDNQILISEQRKTDNFHNIFKCRLLQRNPETSRVNTPRNGIDVNREGDIKICLDNTFSHFASKMVFFELISDDEDDDDDGTSWEGAREELQEIVDMTLEDFKDMLERMGQNLDKSRNIQTVLKMYEARDRNIVESNFDRVNLLSFIQMAIMVCVGLVQVMLIRNLFDDKGRFTGMMKTRT